MSSAEFWEKREKRIIGKDFGWFEGLGRVDVGQGVGGEDWVGGGYYDVVPLLLLHLLLSSNQNPCKKIVSNWNHSEFWQQYQQKQKQQHH